MQTIDIGWPFDTVRKVGLHDIQLLLHLLDTLSERPIRLKLCAKPIHRQMKQIYRDLNYQTNSMPGASHNVDQAAERIFVLRNPELWWTMRKKENQQHQAWIKLKYILNKGTTNLLDNAGLLQLRIVEDARLSQQQDEVSTLLQVAFQLEHKLGQLLVCIIQLGTDLLPLAAICKKKQK